MRLCVSVGRCVVLERQEKDRKLIQKTLMDLTDFSLGHQLSNNDTET